MDQNKFVQFLWNALGGSKFKGARAAEMELIPGLLKRIGEGWEKFREGTSDIIKPGLIIFFNRIVAIVENPTFQAGIARWSDIAAGAFLKVMQWAKAVAKPIIAIALAIDGLAQKHPALMKFIVAMAFMGTMSLFAFGGIRILTAGFAWLIVPLLRLPVYLQSLKIGLFAIQLYGYLAAQGILAIGRAGLALLLNPIFLAIAGIALGAFLIIKYWTPIKAFFAGIANWIMRHLRLIGEIVLYIMGPIGWIVLAFMNWNKIGPIVMGVVNTVVGWFTSMINWFSSLPDKMWEAGKNIMLSLWGGIKSAAMYPIKAIGDIAQKIRNFWPFSPAKEGPLRDLDKAGIGFASQITRGLIYGTPDIKKAAATAGLAAMLALQSVSVAQADVAFAAGAHPGLRSLMGMGDLHMVEAADERIYNKPWDKYHFAAEFPNSVSNDAGGGSDMGMGGGAMTGGMINYITQHMERGSIIINTSNLDLESFLDALAGKVAKRMVEDK